MDKEIKIVLIIILLILGVIAFVFILDKIETKGNYQFYLTQSQIDGILGEEEGGIQYVSGTGEEEKEMCVNACSKRCVAFGYKYYDSLPIFDEYSEEKCSCFCTS